MTNIKFIKKFWRENESKIVVILTMILVAIFSWEAGVLQGKKWQSQPIVIEKPAAPPLVKSEGNNQKKGVENKVAKKVKGSKTQFQKQKEDSILNQNQECAFVGSKNSNKYHLPTCHWAKKIKPANRRCFKSAEDAKQQGYVPASCVKKK